MLAHDTKPNAERLFSVAAILACPITQSGVDHDRVAHDHMLHVCANGFDDTGRVGPDGPRRHDRHAWKPIDEPEIEMIERGGANPNEDLGGTGRLGLRQIVAELNPVEAAVRAECQCLQIVASIGWDIFGLGVI